MDKKHILIGVTGGIAAYKACDLVSRLSKEEVELRVIMTQHAAEFVSPLSFETLSGHRVETDLFDPENEDPISHISLAKWADAFVVVPCTANVLAKVVHGMADDLLTSTFLAATCPKLLCPAMNVNMYENPVTQENIQKAKELGYTVLEPGTGLLACHDTGKGKLPDVSIIFDAIFDLFVEKELTGKRVLISAGPTQEALDPVRYITNHSSGKQGYAIAKAARSMGADVTIVSGPVALEPLDGVEIVSVTSAQDMYDEMTSRQKDADYIIMSAAVADYRPAHVAEEKMKKSDDDLHVDLVRNPDILATLGANKAPGQLICGFAMETSDLDNRAKEKMIKKNCDLLIGNNLNTNGAGFKGDTNVVTLVTKDELEHWEKSTKLELGYKLLKRMIQLEKETK